jgi:hypothetical protein
MGIIFRSTSTPNAGATQVKNAALTYAEGDGNFAWLATNLSGSTVAISGSTTLVGTLSVSGGITGYLFGTSGWAVTASHALNAGAGGAGTAGTSGVAGTSGTSGVAGTSGTSGVTGTSGTSGTSGITGTSGTSGIGSAVGTSPQLAYFSGTNSLTSTSSLSWDANTLQLNVSGGLSLYGGGLYVSGTIATSGSNAKGLVAPLKFNRQTANYTLAYSDEGKMVEMSASTNVQLVLTVPTNTAVPLPIGTEITIIQAGTGSTNITGDTGVTVNSYLGYSMLPGQNAAASVVKRDTNSWYLFGNVELNPF